MRRFVLPLLGLLALAPVAQAEPAVTQTSGCQSLTQGGVHYVACTFDPARASIALRNRAADGKPYGAFEPLFRQMLAAGELPVFAMNGGMYESDETPVGFYVEDGKELKAANTRSGWGNFHLKPNGVFWLAEGKAGVEETGAYLSRGAKPDFATQSGPMLVIEGRLHPAFLPDSDSLKIRNGVGVDREGRVHFVVSDDPVRFYDMAVLFRDALGCPNALFLDGSISSLYAPELGRFDRIYPMGPIITVSVRLPWRR